MIPIRFNSQSLMADHGGTIRTVTILGWMSKIKYNLYVEECVCHIVQLQKSMAAIHEGEDIVTHYVSIAFRHPLHKNWVMKEGLHWIFENTKTYAQQPTSQELADDVCDFFCGVNHNNLFHLIDFGIDISSFGVLTSMLESKLRSLQQHICNTQDYIEKRADFLFHKFSSCMSKYCDDRHSEDEYATAENNEIDCFTEDRDWFNQARYAYISGRNEQERAELEKKHPVWRLRCNLNVVNWKEIQLVQRKKGKWLVCTLDLQSLHDLNYFHYVCADGSIVLNCAKNKYELQQEWLLCGNHLVVDVSALPDLDDEVRSSLPGIKSTNNDNCVNACASINVDELCDLVYLAKVAHVEENARSMTLVLTDISYQEIPSGCSLQTGASVVFQLEGRLILQSHIVALEHIKSWQSDHSVGFLLPPGIRKSDLPIGTEIWLRKR
jgi:hypothetical protein